MDRPEWLHQDFLLQSLRGDARGEPQRIHVIKERTGKSLYEAANDLGRYLGIKDTITISDKKRRRKAKSRTSEVAATEEDLIPMREQSPEVLSALRSAAEQYHNHLMSGQEESSAAEKYLTSRGVERGNYHQASNRFLPRVRLVSTRVGSWRTPARLTGTISSMRA